MITYIFIYIYVIYIYITIFYKPDQTMRGWKEHCTLCILSSCKFTSERHKPPLLDFPNTYYDMIQLSRRWEALGRRRWGPGPRGQTKKNKFASFCTLTLLRFGSKMHPLWPDHHGKRVWGGAPAADAEYVKLFNQAAGARSQKEARLGRWKWRKWRKWRKSESHGSGAA